MIGNKEVTAMGIASVIHHMAIQKVQAKTATPSSLNPAGGGRLDMSTKSNGPKNRPIFFALKIFKIDADIDL